MFYCHILVIITLMKRNYNNIEKIIKKLASKKQTISFAESCTGGRVASEFTSVAGASAVFNGSVVTYSNKIKHKWLNVDNKLLEKFGAVSTQCVSSMLKGIQNLSNSDYAIAISGIAGPDGGSKEKPVGTVYIGIVTPKKEKVFHCLFNGNRTSIQEQSTEFAIEKIAKFLEI